MITSKNKLAVAIAFGLAITVFFAFIASFTVLDLWQLKLSDRLFKDFNPSENIIIVRIDEKTIDPVNGLGEVARWTRAYYAQALENLNKYNPKVVAFDVFFAGSREPKGDKKFIDALAKTSHPILALIFKTSETTGRQGIELPYEPLRTIENIVLRTVDTLPDKDAVVRNYLPYTKENETQIVYDSIALAAVKAFAPLQATNIDELSLPYHKMLINYASSPSSQLLQYRSISFLDLYKDEYVGFNPNQFKDKIVLFGASFRGSQDAYFTPPDPTSQMYGVEIHANAIQTILDQKFLRNMEVTEKIILLAVLCLAAAFVFLYTPIWLSLVFLCGIAVLYTLAAGFAFDHGLILDLVHPYLALVTVFVASYMYRYFTEFKEKTQLKGAFSRYVNPDLVKQILEHPENVKLGGEKREITVLFTDIAHFTSISEKLTPESLVTLLNEYFQAMSDVIMAEGGTVDKYEGDAIMAFFGAPLQQEDHALRAGRTALKMREKLEELLGQWEQAEPLPGGEQRPVIDFRCGLSSGEVIVGNMGSSKHLEYTVMGDIVNLGSRLEGANKKYGTHIMVSEATHEKVKDFFAMRELDIIKVVGKNQSIKVYELLNLKGELVPAAAQLLDWYNEGINLYHQRKFAQALEQFEKILKVYSQDEPSKLYKQRCEVLRDFPPPANWDGVFEMGSK